MVSAAVLPCCLPVCRCSRLVLVVVCRSLWVVVGGCGVGGADIGTVFSTQARQQVGSGVRRIPSFLHSFIHSRFSFHLDVFR